MFLITPSTSTSIGVPRCTDGSIKLKAAGRFGPPMEDGKRHCRLTLQPLQCPSVLLSRYTPVTLKTVRGRPTSPNTPEGSADVTAIRNSSRGLSAQTLRRDRPFDRADCVDRRFTGSAAIQSFRDRSLLAPLAGNPLRYLRLNLLYTQRYQGLTAPCGYLVPDRRRDCDRLPGMCSRRHNSVDLHQTANRSG